MNGSPHQDIACLVELLLEAWRGLGPDRAPLWVTEHPVGDGVDARHLTVQRAWRVVTGSAPEVVSPIEAAAVLRVHFGAVAVSAGRSPLPVSWGTVSATSDAGEYEVSLRWAGLGGWGRRYRVDDGRVELVTAVWVS